MGIIALTDCSSIVIAHEKGLFKKYGINSTVSKGASWAAIRDSLTNGDIQATHMLLGMPIASTMGLGGAPKKPMVAPFILNRNGQAITLSNTFKGKVAADPKALKPFVDEAKAKGTPLTFAMTFPPGTHAFSQTRPICSVVTTSVMPCTVKKSPWRPVFLSNVFPISLALRMIKSSKLPMKERSKPSGLSLPIRVTLGSIKMK
jgi:hypothetical protein